MHPLDFLASMFSGGRPDQAGSAAGPNQQKPLDWLDQFHNMLATHSGGFLSPTAVYNNNPANAPNGYNWMDIAKQAQKIADTSKKSSK